MKRIIVIVMALLLLVSSSYAASLDFYSAYSHTEMLENDKDAPFMSYIHFKENHICYYCEQMFYHDRPGTSCAYVGTWEYAENGDVLVKLGRTFSTFTLHILDSEDLIHTETMQIFNKTNAIWVSK